MFATRYRYLCDVETILRQSHRLLHVVRSAVQYPELVLLNARHTYASKSDEEEVTPHPRGHEKGNTL